MQGILDVPIRGGEDDPLNDAPPSPTATPAKMNRIPKGGADDDALSASTSSLLGGNPAAVMVKGMMQIEKLVNEMSKYSPILQQIFAPAIAQARDIAAASLAGLVSGGTGAVDASGMPPAGMGMGAPAGGPGGPMPPPPPPGM